MSVLLPTLKLRLSVSLEMGKFRDNSRNRRLMQIRRCGAAGGSLVVPMEELMRNLPLAVPLEQSEYVGSSGIGSSQLA